MFQVCSHHLISWANQECDALMDGPNKPGNMNELFADATDEPPIQTGADKDMSSPATACLVDAQQYEHVLFIRGLDELTFPYFSRLWISQEKELKSFMQSVLQKTSKLHQLSGELQKNFDDPKATQTLVWMYISDVPMGFDSSNGFSL